MTSNGYLRPIIHEGRLFVSPVLGCSGACSYCYLAIKDYNTAKQNTCTVAECLAIAKESSEFVWGRNGTIISVGAWGDIFPHNNLELTEYSVRTVKSLLAWGNPVQIMSKYSLQEQYIKEIVNEIRYPEQLLYSTTITSIKNWDKVEPGTCSPQERLSTCLQFYESNVPTCVLLKPFIINLTGAEIEHIIDYLLDYRIKYCILGVMYANGKIINRIRANTFLFDKMDFDKLSFMGYLDCNGTISIESTEVSTLLPYIMTLKRKGISAFLKSSCVNANVLRILNPSHYYQSESPYCIRCGNCQRKSIDQL